MAAISVSPAQVKSLLWSDAALRVHAVVSGAAVPGLPARLAAADVAGWDCLQRGALSAEAAASAAYAVQLSRDAAFTDWLLFEASAGLPDWGVIASSRLALLDIREHFRALCDVRLPDGSARRWRWHDPAVLDAFLPRSHAAQQQAVLGPLHQIVSPRQAVWTWYALDQGTLRTEQRQCVGSGA